MGFRPFHPMSVRGQAISKISPKKQLRSKIDENKKQFTDLLKQTIPHNLKLL